MNPSVRADMSDPWYRTAFGDHYPLLYAHRDAAEARRCLELLPRLAPLTPAGSGLPVLDLGCGDGRHLAYLSRHTGLAIGLDLSASLLDLARERVLAQTSGSSALLRADMRRIPLATGSVGGVLSLFTSFGYFGSIQDNLVVIKEVARVLAGGGHWFLDYLDCRRVREELAAWPQGKLRSRRLGPCRCDELRRLDDTGSRVYKDVAVQAVPERQEEALAYGIGPRGLAYTEQVALFEVAELDAIAAVQGLRRCAAVGNYQGDPLGTGDRWLLVYERDPGLVGDHD